eukprot:TRINITY_DN1075_c0_g2_i1.p1 TRINITY_DN1075_c0_g2~~TRINITY_DN1075_c0_g2_i1.p1  ORF type:complete len:1001 (+),score=345.85 TRINITY_DN1075_c0_g2_i1:117-3119(+)
MAARRGRSRRHLPPARRVLAYAHAVAVRGGVFAALLALACISKHAGLWGAADGADPLAEPAPHYVTTPRYAEYSEFNRMNFEQVAPGQRCDLTHCYETTGELLEPFVDAHGTPYKERRWAFSSGVDYIARYPDDWTFCDSYILVPAENVWWRELRAFLYLITLIYIFLGVAIISDIFMSGIEKITSEKVVMTTAPDGGQVPQLGPDGEPVTAATWNDTVANLTLMALGSSAPEICLSLIETLSTLDQVPGELGPSTIVGSAAFNLLCISAVCMWALPATIEGAKRIELFGVFCITAFFSIFAYVWLLIVLLINTPDVVDVWEALLTFAFFPILVGLAYAQDRNWFRGGEEGPQVSRQNTTMSAAGLKREVEAAAARQIKEHPGDVDEESIANAIADKHKPKLNHGHYRVNATRLMMQKGAVLGPHSSRTTSGDVPSPSVSDLSGAPGPKHGWTVECRGGATPGRGRSGKVQFLSPTYVCSEGDGHVRIEVVRSAGCDGRVTATYQTQDLTAQKGKHYTAASGELVWEDGEVGVCEFTVPIIDNTERNAARIFTVKLTATPDSVLGQVSHTVVTIEDDDLPGDVTFTEPFLVIPESRESVRAEVTREGGAAGSLRVSYHTDDGDGEDAAVAGKDYVASQGALEFEHLEKTKYVDITIMDHISYDPKLQHFFLQIDSVELVSPPPQGTEDSCQGAPTPEQFEGPKMGRFPRMRIDIINDKEHQDMVDRIKDRVRAELDINQRMWSSSWAQLFREAFVVGGEDEELGPVAYLMHFLTFFWKVIFALVPPPDYAGGWACFTVALFFIGLLTKMVEETATLLGCTMGLEKPVTAITFVALGTSLPDTFASRQAIMEEDNADAAIGNVTGSNSVNVFLGLGLPWTVAVIYYAAKGECYVIPSGDLAFTVMVFAICGIICLGVIFFLRLVHPQKAEMGGPLKGVVAGIFLTLWIAYVMLSSLQVYHDFASALRKDTCPGSCLDGSQPHKGIVTGMQRGKIYAGCPVP